MGREQIEKLLVTNFTQDFLETYRNYKIFAQKADFARYAILYVYGGIYLDMDMMCKKNLSHFLKYNFFFTNYAMQSWIKRYLNGIIGSRPQHPIFLTIFKNIFLRKNIAHNVMESTGPGLFYYAVQEYVRNNPNNDITIDKSEVFWILAS